jgi:hypothetical protein
MEVVMQTPALDYLLGAYFHQDFFDEHGGVWETVDAFIANDPHRAEQVSVEIDQLLAESTEEEIVKHVDGAGSAYAADWDGGTYRGWLTGIADRVRRATAGPA